MKFSIHRPIYYVLFCLSILLVQPNAGVPQDADQNAQNPISNDAAHTIHIVPQSHIDVVWLWRYDPETIHRCCKMTYTQALDNMDRFPDYTFCQSQVPLYEPLETIYPDIYRRIKEYVRQGRWEIVGGMYVEPEGGEPSGESWVRQCVMGKRWFQKKFGLDITTGWQPDAWGHPAQLPQIMAKSGINSYLWRRGDAGGPRNNVSEKLFWWQAPDGSKVFAYRFVDPEHPPYPEWKNNVQISRQKYHLNDTMIVIGWGDHGGGPSDKDIQITQEFARSVPSNIKVKFGVFGEYVKSVLQQNPQLPTIKGDLGYELQGDLTNVGEIKKSNRECENLLLSAEKWASVAAQWFSFEYPQEEFAEAWKKLLFNQFHDILGGSLIPEAIGDAMQYYQSVRDSGAYITNSALQSIVKSIHAEGDSQAIVAFNSLSWKRTDAVETTVEFSQAPQNLVIKDERGNALPLQILDRAEKKGKSQIRCLFIARDVPSVGYKTFFLNDAKDAPTPSSTLSAGENKIENEFFLVEVNPYTGCLKRIYDKRNEREMLPESGEANDLVAIEDEGDSEGRFVLRSDVAGRPPGRAESVHTLQSIRVVENGPARAIIRIEKKYQNSLFTQDVILYAGVDRVDFNLSMDWRDVERMIKIAFPFALKNPQAVYEVPFAAAPYPANGMEYPAQKWVDLYSGGYGISLLNNGRYAHDVQENVIRLSVLRSPTHPACNTDEGKHTLGYSLYPHKGEWNQAPVAQQGYNFNNPLIAVAAPPQTGTSPQEKSFISIQPDNIILEAVKQAYDSNQTVLRLFEMNGQDASVTITFPTPILSAQETDLLENEIARLNPAENELQLEIKPHEIKTIEISWK